jgi:hypothetical protein
MVRKRKTERTQTYSDQNASDMKRNSTEASNPWAMNAYIVSLSELLRSKIDDHEVQTGVDHISTKAVMRLAI